MVDLSELMPSLIEIVKTAAGIGIFFAICSKVVKSISNAFRGKGTFL